MVFIKKSIIPFCLIMALTMTMFAPVTAYAAALPSDTSEKIIDITEYLNNKETYDTQTKEIIENASVGKLNSIKQALGNYVLTYFIFRGIDVEVTKITSLAQTTGAFLLEHYDELDEAIQVRAASVAANIESDSNYYETHNYYITQGLMSRLDSFLGNYVDSGTINLNKGLVAQEIIPESAYTNSMTATAYNTYSGYASCMYTKTNISTTPYYIYSFPDTITYALINNAQDTVTFYDSNGTRVASGDESMIYYRIMYEGTVNQKNEWIASSWSSFRLTGDVVGSVYYNGLQVLIGDTFADAVGLNVDYNMDINKENDLGTPLYPTQNTELTAEQIQNLATGQTDLATEGIETTTEITDDSADTDGSTGILDAIIAIPAQVAEAIGNMLKSLFIPSDAAIEEVKTELDEKVPAIEEIQAWSDDFVYVMDNPEAYASTLNFNVDFGKADTYWDYGGSSTNMISLDWYFDYKDKVDEIIVGIAWLVFIWNLFGQLPAIISAVGTGVYLDTRNTHINNQGAGKTKTKGGGE